jgi:4-hydroxybenzoate polyprenyltransferase
MIRDRGRQAWHVLTSSSWQLALAARPYSLPYVAALGLLGVLTDDPGASLGQRWQAVWFGPAVWTLCVVCHDQMHQRADAKTRPERRNRTRHVWGWIAVLAAALLVSLLCSGIAVGAAVMATMLCAIGYGLFKKQPFLAIPLRGCAGAGTVWAGAYLGKNQPGEAVLMISVVVALFDAAGNVLGDLRDRKIDKISGTTTLATYSRNFAMLVASCLHLVGLYLFANELHFASGSHLVVALGVLLLVSAIVELQDRWMHLVYLLWKYLVVAFLLGFWAKSWMAVALVVQIPAIIFMYDRIHARSPK